MHPVFHVSNLKWKVGEWISPQTHLPFVNKDGIIQAQPVAILDRRLIKRHGRTDAKVLVRWQGAGDEKPHGKSTMNSSPNFQN